MRQIRYPHQAFDPSKTPQAPPSDTRPGGVVAQGEDFETRTEVIDATASAVTRFRLERPWHACDVYVALSAPFQAIAANNAVRIRVFAVLPGSGPVLVASGLTRGRNRDGATVTPSPEWVASARAVNAFFEVEVSIVAANATGTPKMTITIAGSKATNPPPDWVGCCQADRNGAATDNLTALAVSGAGMSASQTELVEVQAATTAAAARFIQYFDVFGALPAAGSVPDMVWGIPAGGGVLSVRPRIRAKRAVMLVTSSAPGTFVAPGLGDTFIQAIVR